LQGKVLRERVDGVDGVVDRVSGKFDIYPPKVYLIIYERED
jgi:hypothetical protein|tara:strand:- start:2463 stop:2585 length:123 start_codon:yes stop_codon:yes gene_type:complete